jgi:hypothetical protein
VRSLPQKTLRDADADTFWNEELHLNDSMQPKLADIENTDTLTLKLIQCTAVKTDDG